ncbi:hypothetical protein QN277_028473 [Acacia crassicarpa]|uniref:FAS1 domain-containing protein n=1 Tax=Acacia crassicarpa TaxID=499986 RepID=A0AAE1MF63_9FABA|nr:hypothetical protein QN277_028473 [Acacia crassicarpa]
MLLQTLEDTVGAHNITIFAPKNEDLNHNLDLEFKRFILEPGNLKSLQSLLMFHIIPTRMGSQALPTQTRLALHQTFFKFEFIHLANNGTGEWIVDRAKIIHPNVVA